MEKKITIALAVYKPNIEWLKLLLQSLNNQSYKNIELIICDDCPESPVNPSIFEEYIKNFPYKIYQNKKNIGSNLTFEYLTSLATGDYIAYCDQDDIWTPNKLERLKKELELSNSLLSFSDMFIIDAQNKKIANSITKIRRRHIFLSGENLSKQLLVRNFVTGCTMLVNSQIAKEAIPFATKMVHDHWLALYASSKGSIKFVNESLIYYRQHSQNQTGVFIHVAKKSDYLKERILKPQQNLYEIKNRFPYNKNLTSHIKLLYDWFECRKNWWQKFSVFSAIQILKQYRLNPSAALFELVSARMPEFIFSFFIQLIKKNKL